MAGRRRAVGRLIAFGIVTGFVILAIVVVERVVRHPQTDDAVVTADIIGVVPQVSGTITELHVKDNQRVKQGDLLLVVDPRPYAFARMCGTIARQQWKTPCTLTANTLSHASTG